MKLTYELTSSIRYELTVDKQMWGMGNGEWDLTMPCYDTTSNGILEIPMRLKDVGRRRPTKKKPQQIRGNSNFQTHPPIHFVLKCRRPTHRPLADVLSLAHVPTADESRAVIWKRLLTIATYLLLLFVCRHLSTVETYLYNWEDETYCHLNTYSSIDCKY